MCILQQLNSRNALSTTCLGQVIFKIMQLKILLRVQWTRLVVKRLIRWVWGKTANKESRVKVVVVYCQRVHRNKLGKISNCEDRVRIARTSA
jgi:hypothetical protein